MKTRTALLPALASIMLAVAACGGGGGGGGNGPRITDPDLVASATPLGPNATLYQIRNDTISVSGGESSSVRPGATATPARQTYTVKAGDNCGIIAEFLKTTVELLRQANRQINADCSNLNEGNQLRAPVTAAPVGTATPTVRSSGKTYVVEDGDNCGSIAASYGVTVAALIGLNGIDADCVELKVGQTVKIP